MKDVQLKQLTGGGVHRTDIEWADYAVGGLVRAQRPDQPTQAMNYCVPVSEGCRHCYASAITGRFKGHRYEAGKAKKLTWFFDEAAAQSLLTFKPKPVRGQKLYKNGRARPLVFLGDMTDCFGEWVKDEWLDRMFAVMALRPDVDFAVLTKRPGRMAEYLTLVATAFDGAIKRPAAWERMCRQMRAIRPDADLTDATPWPLPNVWLGVSAERQQEFDARIWPLLTCPAAVHFLSLEPLLGTIDLTAGHGAFRITTDGIGALGVDWVIAGGESGPGARHFDVAWGQSIVSQCVGVGVPVFMKQLGANPSATLAETGTDESDHDNIERLELRDPKGGDPAEWPEGLRVRQVPGGGT